MTPCGFGRPSAPGADACPPSWGRVALGVRGATSRAQAAGSGVRGLPGLAPGALLTFLAAGPAGAFPWDEAEAPPAPPPAVPPPVATMPETLSAMPETLSSAPDVPAAAAAAPAATSAAGAAADAVSAAADKVADAAPAAADAASAAADAAEKGGGTVPAVVLGLSPILLYGIFFLYREKFNPNVKVSDFLFAVLAIAVWVNFLSSIVFKFRFF